MFQLNTICDKKYRKYICSECIHFSAFYTGLPLETVQKLQLVQSASAQAVMVTSCGAHVLLLPCELFGFQIHLKVLVVTFKALHGIGLGYLKDLPFVVSGRVVALQVSSIK